MYNKIFFSRYYYNLHTMVITSILILSLVLILFRILRGESLRDIRREIKDLKAQDVPHFFFRSVKIVFSFKGIGYKRKLKKKEEEQQKNS
ncbi:MAG: hypothetical protein J6X58_01310 [Bacteroidales bacterium]|nr:hypothetical protein [Bacteroidales bacterium]